MDFCKTAKDAAMDILQAFENPPDLPPPLTKRFIKRTDDVPCRLWSWRCQMIVALHGHSDARTREQWAEVRRCVRDREPPLEGIKGAIVFGYSQTYGDPLVTADSATQVWLQSLPLIGVATTWGYSVEAFNGVPNGSRGGFHPRGGIALGVKNLLTWMHELIHTAEHERGSLGGEKWEKETVAQFGAAVLLQMLGYENEVDLGCCWDQLQRFTREPGISVQDACVKMSARTWEAITLILDTAERLQVTMPAGGTID